MTALAASLLTLLACVDIITGSEILALGTPLVARVAHHAIFTLQQGSPGMLLAGLVDTIFISDDSLFIVCSLVGILRFVCIFLYPAVEYHISMIGGV